MSAVATAEKPAAPAESAAPESATPAAQPTAPAKSEAQPAPAAQAPAFEFKNADGSTPDPEHVKELTALAQENKWTPDQATKFYQRDVARNAAVIKAHTDGWDAAAAEGEKIARADPVIGGAKFDGVYARAKQLLDKFQPEGMPSAWEGLVRLKLDKDPILLRILHSIDEGQREPTSVVGGTQAKPAPKTPGEVFYPGMTKKE